MHVLIVTNFDLPPNTKMTHTAVFNCLVYESLLMQLVHYLTNGWEMSGKLWTISSILLNKHLFCAGFLTRKQKVRFSGYEVNHRKIVCKLDFHRHPLSQFMKAQYM